MELNLDTDVEFQNKKMEIEDRVDELIESSKMNLSSKIREQLKDEDEDESTLNETLKIINEDLEEKRIYLKQHFVSQIETITVKAFNDAIARMTA
jgi:hypothetical protein